MCVNVCVYLHPGGCPLRWPQACWGSSELLSAAALQRRYGKRWCRRGEGRVRGDVGGRGGEG